MKLTKAQKVWRERYDNVRSIKNGMDAVNAANRTLEEELGVTVSYLELPNEAVVEARLPNGQVKRESEVGYLTTTICLRMTENLLSKIKVSDLERSKPKAV